MRFLILTICFLQATFFIAQQNSDAPVYHRAKIYYQSNAELLALANQGVPLDHGNHKYGVYIESDFSENELNIARMMNFDVEIVINDVINFYKTRNQKDRAKSTLNIQKNASCGNAGPTYTTPTNWELGSMGGFYTYDEVLQEINAMAAAYPNLISAKQPVGNFQTLEGRSIYWLKISDNPNMDEAEPEVLYDAIHHAREPAAMQQLIYYMWYLLENYDTDLEVQNLVDNTEMYFIPVLNPDGYQHNCVLDSVNGGEMWRKNRRNHGNGDYGVDNNRNYDFHENGQSMWGTEGISFSTSSDVYCGTGPFSEVENQAMKWFCEQHEFKLAMNNHAWDNSLLFPYGYDNNKFTPDHNYYQAIGAAMTEYNTLGMQAKLSSLLYPASGDSDDWMYGDDLATKPKIISFTPEIGNSGFWPAMSEIENICNSMVFTNLTAAHLVTNFARVYDDSPSSVNDLNGHFLYSLERLGLAAPGDFTVSITPVSGNISSIGSANSHTAMNLLQMDADSISYTLDGSIQPGDMISYKLVVNNGSYDAEIMVNKIYGSGSSVFTENGGNTSAWNITGAWSATTEDFVSAPTSITDSPNGDYGSSQNRTISLTNSIDLTNVQHADLTFFAKWNIEDNYDYVQVEVLTNQGSSWEPQCGNFTNLGSSNQDNGAPLYDGIQNTWVQEVISLSDYIGSTIQIRFQLVTDNFVNEDGFYFDDLSINTVSSMGVEESINPFGLSAYPNPASGDVTLSWEGEKAGKLIITDAQGRTVSTHDIAYGELSFNLDITDYAAGVYQYYFLTDGSKSTAQSLVISK